MSWTKLEQKETFLNQKVRGNQKELEGALYKDHLIILEGIGVPVSYEPPQNKLLYCLNLSILSLESLLILNRHQLVVNFFCPADQRVPFFKKSGCP